MFPGAGWQGRAGETWGKEMGSACTSQHSHTWVHQRPWKESLPGFEPAPTYCVPLTALSLHFLNYKLEIKPVVLTRCLGVEHRKLAQSLEDPPFPQGPRGRAGSVCAGLPPCGRIVGAQRAPDAAAQFRVEKMNESRAAPGSVSRVPGIISLSSPGRGRPSRFPGSQWLLCSPQPP